MENTAVKNERNMGIDLLRIFAMFTIMILHVQGRGGVFDAVKPLSVNYEVAWVLELLCWFGMTSYGIISGYVGINGKFKISNIAYLWLQVVFYGVVVTLLFGIFQRSLVSWTAVRYAIFPVMSESYWYFSAYFGVFFLIPIIKLGFDKLERIYLDLILLFIIVFFTILPIFFPVDVFSLKLGYSFMWLLSCFYVGAYMKRFDVFSKMKTYVLVLIHFGCVFIIWLSKFLIEIYYGAEVWNRDRGNVLVIHNSIFNLLSAMCMVVIFSRIKVSGKLKTVLSKTAPLFFGIYLSNCQPLIWENLMAGRFASYAELPAYRMVLCVILTALIICVIGIAVDAIRYLIFELLHIRKILTAVENYLLLCYTIEK